MSAAVYRKAAETIRNACPLTPDWAIVLGSGLGGLGDQVAVHAEFAYEDLPGFPRSTAIGHAGRLLLGQIGKTNVAVMQGRFHLYEGWNPQQAVLGVQVLRLLGARSLLVTNAAGGLDPQMQVGDPMVITDHINLMFRNPLVGMNDDDLGPRFPDMSQPYDPAYRAAALAAARRAGFMCHQGVYAGMLGPTYETRGEYRMLRRLGAQAAGMSTVPEVIAAAHAGMRVMGISTITNVCSPDTLGETSGEEVVSAANQASEKVMLLARAVLESDSFASSPSGGRIGGDKHEPSNHP